MKKNKTLKSILMLSLLLTLGACTRIELEDESSFSEDSSASLTESSDDSETRETSETNSESTSTSESESSENSSSTSEDNPSEDSDSETNSSSSSDSDPETNPDPDPDPEIDLTGNPTSIDNILDRVNVTNNYSLEIEYYEKYSDTFTEVPSSYSLNHTRHYMVDINYTDDAALLNYYQITTILTFDIKTWFFTEFYVNTDDGKEDVYWSNSSSTDLYYVTTRSHPWQYYFWSLTDMNNYRNLFVENGTYYDDTYGEYINYIINPASVYQFEYILMQILFAGGNYLVDDAYVHGPANVTILYENYSDIGYSCNYYIETGEWKTSLDTGTSGWRDSQTGEIWYERDQMYSCVYDVSQTVIPDSYSSYLN